MVIHQAASKPKHFSFPTSPKLTKLFRGTVAGSDRVENDDDRDGSSRRRMDVNERRTQPATDPSLSPRFRKSRDLSPRFNYVGSSLVDSGVRYQSQGDYEKALKSFNSALRMQRLTLQSTDHICIAHTLGNIGAVQLQQGKVTQAMSTLEEAIQMKMRLRPRDSDCTAASRIIFWDTLMNLGSGAYMQGDVEEGLVLFEEACNEIRSQPPTVTTRQALAEIFYNIGCIYFAKQCWEAALPVLKDSHHILCGIYGGDDAQTVDSLNLIGFIQLCSSSLDAATESFTKCLWINVRCHGSNDPEVAASWFNIAMVRAARGDHKGALTACHTSRLIYNGAGKKYRPGVDDVIRLEKMIKGRAKK